VPPAHVLAVDAGTTGVRVLAVDAQGRPGHVAYRELPQHFPRPGWVEHDPDEIWDAVVAALGEVLAQLDGPVAALGITDQRETVVAWDRRTGRPRHRAIVWQDRRTADRCRALRAGGIEPDVRARTGLVLDPYFSATKLAWLLDPEAGGVAADADLAVGTIDTWVLWRLTGGAVHATEPTNASRTMLYDLAAGAWSDDLLARFGVPAHALAELRPSTGPFGRTDPSAACGLDVPITGIAGDQQAALFGQACFDAGETKCTYGTGSFVLAHTGAVLPAPVDGLLTTAACDTGAGPRFALEGAVFVTGAALQWLRDGLGVLGDASEAEALARTVDDTGDVWFVPALTGLGSPWWDPEARGAIVGITRGTTRAHLVRAAVESMAWQVADVVATARAAGWAPRELRVDGGASVMDLLCAFQADVADVPVVRARQREATALGAAWLAGVGAGLWAEADLAAWWEADQRFDPTDAGRADAARRRPRWHAAVDRSRAWAVEDESR
jgi:glycerol kinase